MFGVPGIALQIVGQVAYGSVEPVGNPLWVGVMLAGTVLLIVGLSFYAKGKGLPPNLRVVRAAVDHRSDRARGAA